MVTNAPGQQPEQNNSNEEKVSALSGFSAELGDLKNLIDAPNKAILKTPQNTKKSESIAKKTDNQEAQELLNSLKGSDELNRSEETRTSREAVDKAVQNIPTMQKRAQYAKNAEELYANLGGGKAVDNMITNINKDPRGLGLKYGNFSY